MESVGRLHHPQPSASGPATLTARSNADGRYDRRLSRAKKRRRAGNEKLVARLAVPRHHDRHVENIRASTSLSPCVQRKIWVKISPLGRGGCQQSFVIPKDMRSQEGTGPCSFRFIIFELSSQSKPVAATRHRFQSRRRCMISRRSHSPNLLPASGITPTGRKPSDSWRATERTLIPQMQATRV